MTTAHRSGPLIIGNWKMYLTASQAIAFLHDLLPRLPPLADREVALAPPFTALPAVGPILADSQVRLAAQDVFWEDEGAFTGEISPVMLQELGVSYVLVGHSERRSHLGETDLMVSHKIRAALRADLQPVVCVGEQEAARESGRARGTVRSQVARALEEITPGEIHRVAVAYEPIWAIGTGKAAVPADVSEMHAVIRSELRRLFGEPGSNVRILYGGSVSAANIDSFMAAPGVEGVLVGGASARAADFARIAGSLQTA
jgi:triosephosphate isomerase (TIM)